MSGWLLVMMEAGGDGLCGRITEWPCRYITRGSDSKYQYAKYRT